MNDIKILKFLYSKKNDCQYYDVSKIFNITNPINYNDEIEDLNETAILPKSQKIFNRLRKFFIPAKDKHEIDKFVVGLEENGYVTKIIEGFVSLSMIPQGEDTSIANNSICKITSKGIEYYENKLDNFKSRRLSQIAIIISVIALLFSVFCNK